MSAYTTKQKRLGLNNQNVYCQRAKLGDMVYAAAAGGYPGSGYPGVILYVDNIRGSSSNDGLTWDTPMDQISTAVTAWEAVRTAYAAATTGSNYTRGIIYVQGTSTAYTALTALPNYCDIVGIGADPRGNGTGIASVTGSSTTDTVSSTGVRGLGVYNMQFTGTGAAYGMNLAICFRSDFVNCAFMNRTTGGLNIATGGGINISHCLFGGDTTYPVTALTVGTGGSGGGNFNQCLVEDSVFYGSTTGIVVSAYLCDQTVFKNNVVYGGTYGIQDTCSDSNLASNAWYAGNFISAGTTALALTNNASNRAMGNLVINNTAGAHQLLGT